MIRIHPAGQRGTFRNDWLDARFSFEFGAYRNAERRPYSDLLVFNEDIVAPGRGFAMHPHDNVEVMSYPLEGSVEHQDSLGNRETIVYGDVHLMRAGSGIVHSEMNASATQPETHIQWWIAPAHQDAAPSYEKRHFPRERKLDRLCLIASPHGDEGALQIDQDIRIYASIVGTKQVDYSLDPRRRAYLHVLSGTMELNGVSLNAGDGAHVENVTELHLRSARGSEILLFDLR